MDWPVTIPASMIAEWTSANSDDRDSAQAIAVTILGALTGNVFGTAAHTVRPCFTPPPASTYSGPSGRAGLTYWPGITTANLTEPGACGCGGSGCGIGPKDVQVPGPIASVTSVVVDGQTIPPAAYRVRNRRWLRRIDGHSWPQHQDLDAADDAVGAFTITYQRGIPVPADGQVAAGRLAVDILRGLQAKACSIPKHVTSLARQGVTTEFDPRTYFAEGLTGIDLVDQWIMAVNPYRSRQPARIVSPDAAAAVEFS